MQIPAPRSHWPLTILMGASSLMNLFLPLILVRVLPADQVGFYKIFFLYATSAPWLLLSSGFANGIYFWIGQQNTRQDSVSATWSYQLLWSSLIFLITVLLTPIVPRFHFLFSDPSVFFLLGTSVALMISATFYEECQIAAGSIRQAAWYSAFWELAKTFGLIFAALQFRSFLSIVIAYVTVTGAKFLISSFLTLRKKMATFSLRNNPQAKAVLRYAIPSSGAAALAVILGYGDQFILGYYLSAAAFATYTLGCLSIPPLLIFEQSVNKVLLPPLAEALGQKSADAWKIVRTAMTDLGLWLIPSSVGLFFFAGPITRLLFTDKFPETEGFLKVYCFYYLAFIIPYDAWARASGRSQWIFKTTALFAGLSLVGTLLGAQFGGAYGALILFLLCQFSIRVYSLLAVRKNLAWPLRKMLPIKHWLVSILLSVILGFATSYGISYFENEKLALVLMGISFWVLYILLVVPWAFRQERLEAESKNILMLTQYLNIGGLERMILNLSQELQRETPWRPFVYVYDEIPGAETLEAAFGEVPVTRNAKGAGFSLKLPLQIARYCRHHYIHQIHAHDLGALIYAVLAKWMSLGKLRVVYTQHSFVHLKKGFKYSVYEKFFAAQADVLTTVSHQLKDGYVRMGFKANKVLVVENGIPFPKALESVQHQKTLKQELLQKRPPKSGELFWLLNLARLHPGKGQTEALQIWQHLSAEMRSRCLLVFVGAETSPNYRHILENEARQMPDTSHIIFAGGTLYPDQWLQACDLLLSASREEGLPLSPLEALSLDKPVFLSDILGHRIFAGQAALFSNDDFVAAARQLEDLIRKTQNAEYRSSYPQEILRRFSVTRMAQDYIHIYNESTFQKDHR